MGVVIYVVKPLPFIADFLSLQQGDFDSLSPELESSGSVARTRNNSCLITARDVDKLRADRPCLARAQRSPPPGL